MECCRDDGSRLPLLLVRAAQLRKAELRRRYWLLTLSARSARLFICQGGHFRRRAPKAKPPTMAGWSARLSQSVPCQLVGQHIRRSASSVLVRWAEIREFGQKISVGSDLFPRHPAIREDSQEDISSVVGKRPAIAWE
jgi:hypothetical protein